ncbi:GIY-YIG nuclease family protein [Oxalicibacterium solurbis]|uniref:GIY-YIG domain-containing protein n=1 Tax=Oxalicibacterium solurbis TaxID=69280 RepID=A0A8J3AZP4_9BURK|nr:GIY-YIG nuclease family protein [Oxalicibacterium solurbis]GGI53967.1 hypothetical protein GCM10011430_11410 [Oxalicibacterium solurbis]
MPQSASFLFKNSVEFLSIDDVEKIPPRIRGIYVLYKEAENKRMDVVYVGMARGENSGAKGRLRSHKEKKSNLWTHFSVFEVWDNITKEQVEELEGLFRHLYRLDTQANKLNIQRRHKTLLKIRRKNMIDWIYSKPQTPEKGKHRVKK